MATGLSNKQPGGIDLTYKWLLHTSGNGFATGVQIGNGNGDDCALVIFTDKLGIAGATNTATITFNGGTDQAFTLPPTGGQLALDDGSTRIKLAANVVVTDTVLTAVGGFEFAPEASRDYTFEMWLILGSANSTKGIKLSIEGAAGQVDVLAYQAWLPETTTTNKDYFRSDFGFEMTTATMPETDTPALVKITGVLHTNATAQAVPISLKIANEDGATATTLHAGSSMKFTKL